MKKSMAEAHLMRLLRTKTDLMIGVLLRSDS